MTAEELRQARFVAAWIAIGLAVGIVLFGTLLLTDVVQAGANTKLAMIWLGLADVGTGMVWAVADRRLDQTRKP